MSQVTKLLQNQRGLYLEVVAVSCPLAEESKVNVHTSTFMCMHTCMHCVYGERGRESGGESTSKLTDASYLDRGEKQKHAHLFYLDL